MCQQQLALTTPMATTQKSGNGSGSYHPREHVHGLDEKSHDVLEDLPIYRLDFESSLNREEDEVSSRELSKEKLPEVLAAGGEALQTGDHVYLWCTMYQHHGIVLETRKASDTTTMMNDSNRTQASTVLIAEFTNAALGDESNAGFMASASVTSGATSGGGVAGGFRIVREINPAQWHKVKYQAHPILECLTWRPGTCSAATPSPVSTILTRVFFLQNCRHLIPDYHLLTCNCETVAVWCMTGKWETLQGDRALHLSQLGCVAVASSTAFVPALPLVGLAAGGLALWHSRQIAFKWEATAERLNREFEWYALGKTPAFVFFPTG